jgi:predicted permease
MNDLRFATRQLLKNPGFTAIAVLTLALGIGASGAIFSLLDGVLFRPLPFPEPHRLVEIYETRSDGSPNSPSGGVFLDWREQHPGFDSVALISPVSRNLRGEGEPERLNGLQATHEFLDVLGVEPLLGRGFLTTDDRPGGDNHVVILSEEIWRVRFASSASVLGSTLRLDEVPHTVVGVLPMGTLPRGVWSREAAQFVVPAVAQRAVTGRYSRSEHWAMVYGRLSRGVSLGQANAGLKALRQQLDSEYPPYKREWGVIVQPLRERLAGGPRPTLLLLMGAVGVLLLIACANVANLLLARARNRRQEIAVRAALGATPRRILRQVLTESLLLASVGGIAGAIISVWGIGLLGRVASEFLPGGMVPQLDFRVLTFSALLTLLTGCIFGILPAWQARRPDLNEVLKSGGKNSSASGRHRTQSILVISEVAMTVVLLSSAGLLLRSLANAVSMDPGFEPRHALAFDLSLPETTYPDDRARLAVSREVVEAIRALPGVQSVGTGMGVPLGGGAFGEGVRRTDQPGDKNAPIARINYVSAGYLEAIGARLKAGRVLSETDDRDGAARAIVVNESVVRRFFQEKDPIGRTLSLLGNEWTIVGVVADVPDRRVDVPSDLFLYVPQVFNAARFSVVVRSAVPPLSLVNGIRREIQRLNPGLPLANIRTLDSALNASLGDRRVVLGLISAFAGAALLLACVGLYGVMSYSVALRRRELSIRLALGAARTDVLQLIFRDALRLVSIGAILGILGAFLAARMLASQLFQITRQDPMVIAATLGIVGLIALLACWVPAWRAANVDSVEALRTE